MYKLLKRLNMRQAKIDKSGTKIDETWHFVCFHILLCIGVFKIPTKNLVYNHSGYRRGKKSQAGK